LETLESGDVHSFYIDKVKNQVIIRGKASRKKEKDRAVQYYLDARSDIQTDDAFTLYRDMRDDYLLGHDFPILFGLMYDFTGDINGGRVEIGIRTDQGNIYLRKSE